MLRVHEASGGNPFYALELARALGGAGGAQRGAPSSRAVAALRDDVRELLLVVVAAARIRRSNASARSFRTQMRDSKLPSTPSCSSGTATGFGSRIALLASAVSEHEGAERQAGRRTGGWPRSSDDSEARARHLALATDGHDADVAAALDHAAHDALARGAPSAAAELLELAIERTPPGPEVDLTRGKLALADAHFSSGAIGRANAVLRELLDELPPGDERADVLVRLANGSPDLEAALELAERALLEVDDDDVVRSRVHLLLGQAWPLRGMVAGARGRPPRARPRGALGGQAPRRRRRSRGSRCGSSGPGATRASCSRGRSSSRSREDALLSYRSPRMPLALLRMYQGRLDEARELFDTLLAEAVAFGDEIAALGVRGRLVDVALRSGDWTEASAQADEAYELAEQIGLEHDGGLTVYWKALVAAHLGRRRRGAIARRARRVARGSGEAGEHARDERRRARLPRALARQRRRRAAAPRAAARLGRLDGARPRDASAAPYAIEALVAAGYVDDASRLIDRLEARSGHDRQPLGPGDRCAQQGAARLGARAPSRSPTSGGRSSVRGRCSCSDELQRRAKQKAAAKESLELARSIFDALPAPLWSERARRGARADRAPPRVARRA